MNGFFLAVIIFKVFIPYSDTILGAWIHPATCCVVLMEILCFIVAIKRLEKLEQQTYKTQIFTFQKERETFWSSMIQNNKVRMVKEQDSFLNRLDDIIKSHMDDPQFNANQLYQILGTNHVSLNKKLKDLTAMSTHQYIQSKKLAYSKKLVLQTEQSFSEIAYSIGLNDPAYFSKLFKKKYNS